MKAAAKSYFGKSLDQLTLAQDAILAAIPQSPTKYDLVRNADEVCLDNVAEGQECTKFKLVVPQDSEIVQRRNHVLDLMKSRSPLTGNKHTPAEYEAAKEEPVELHQQVSVDWKAPALRLAGPPPARPDVLPGHAQQLPRGRYRRATRSSPASTWTCSAPPRSGSTSRPAPPHAKDPLAILSSRKIPKADRTWILGLRGHNINNAAAAVTDYRTGEVLAYVGSASYTSKGNKKFQPQFDVLADGWRQPGSAIKPIDYAIGIDDKTLTASTMIMDVTTNFGGGFIPTQADKLERGPVRLREALQFSLNIPAIKATIEQGLDHTYDRTKDFGLSYPKTAVPVLSMGIGTLEVHPIDLLGAYGTIANGGVMMPRRVIDQIIDSSGKVIWPPADGAPKGTQVISPAAAYVITDILAGNTDKKVNPFWGKWAIFDGKNRRPAAYKTGTTSDNRDVAAYGFVAPPADKNAPAIAVGVWMGNSDNTPNDGKLSLDTSAPLWSAIMREVTKGEKIATFKPPKDIQTATVDAFTGLRPGPFTTKKITEYFVPGTVPSAEGDAPRGGLDRRRQRPPVAGRVPGPEGHPRVLQPVGRRVQLPGLAAGQRGVGRPGGEGLRRSRRAEGHPNRLLLQRRVHAVRPELGRAVHAERAVPEVHPAGRLRPVRAIRPVRDRAAVRPAPARTGQARPGRSTPRGPPRPRSRTRARRSSPRRRLRHAGRGAAT